MSTPEPVEVLRGTHKNPELRFGPLPGRRLGDVVAYEWQLPARFEPWPGRTLVERTFHEQFRGRGLATLTCATLIAVCETEGLATWWDCAKQNEPSVRLARRPGYGE